MDNDKWGMTKTEQERYNRMKNKLRLLLGLRMAASTPFGLLVMVAPIALWWFMNQYKDKAYEYLTPHELLQRPIEMVINVMAVILPLMVLLATLDVIASITARKYEDILKKVFKQSGFRHGYLLLVYIELDKKTDVYTMEVHTDIPKAVWCKNAKSICDNLSIHLLEEIEYGCKRNDTGYRRVLKFKKGRNPKQMGVIEDEI